MCAIICFGWNFFLPLNTIALFDYYCFTLIFQVHEACFLVVGLGIVESNRTNLGSFSSQVFVENVLLPDIAAAG